MAAKLPSSFYKPTPFMPVNQVTDFLMENPQPSLPEAINKWQSLDNNAGVIEQRKLQIEQAEEKLKQDKQRLEMNDELRQVLQKYEGDFDLETAGPEMQKVYGDYGQIDKMLSIENSLRQQRASAQPKFFNTARGLLALDPTDQSTRVLVGPAPPKPKTPKYKPLFASDGSHRIVNLNEPLATRQAMDSGFLYTSPPDPLDAKIREYGGDTPLPIEQGAATGGPSIDQLLLQHLAGQSMKDSRVNNNPKVIGFRRKG